MATDREVIQEFLVSLGFKIDEAGMKKFDNTLSGTTKGFVGMAATVIAAGVAIDKFVMHFADGLEKLYYQSIRTGSTAQNLMSFGQAAAQVGLDADTLKQSVTGMQAAIENSGGGLQEVMRGLGVGDEITDTTERFLALNQALAKMWNTGDAVTKATAIQYAQMFGEGQEQFVQLALHIDEVTSAYRRLQKENADVTPEMTKNARDLENAARDSANAWSKVGRSIFSALEPLVKGFYLRSKEILPKISQFITDSMNDNAFTRGAGNNYDPNAGSTGAKNGDMKWKTDSRGYKNNNPGNLRYAGQDHTIGMDEKGFAKFDTLEHGEEAQRKQLQLYASRGNDTLAGMINTYAPPSDNNDTGAYIADVSKRTGLDPNQHLDMNDPNIVKKVADAMMIHEGSALGGGGDSVTNHGDVTVTNNFQPNITVTATDPQTVAKDTGAAVENAYSRSLRNQKTPFNNVQPQGTQ
jgi:hypothetical protein